MSYFTKPFTLVAFIYLIITLVLTAFAAQITSTSFQILDDSNFETSISTGVWVIAYLDTSLESNVDLNDQFDKTVDEWTGVNAPSSKALKNVKFGAVNCKESPNTCSKKEHKIETYPSFASFVAGSWHQTKSGLETIEDISAFTQVAADKHNLEHTASVILDSENFGKLVGTAGSIWFVKFYSPKCGWSKKLAPHWTEVSDEVAKSVRDKGFYFGEVDCLEFGILCHENKVDGYPTLFTYVNGKSIGEYFGGNTAEPLRAHVLKLSETNVQKVEPAQGTTSDNANPNSGVESTKDEPSEKDVSVELTPENYQEMTSKSLYFIKFYSPSCPACVKLAPTWVEVAKELYPATTVKVAEVDCKAHVKFCIEMGLQFIPTIKLVYKNRVQLYVGDNTKDSLVSFATQGQGAGVEAGPGKKLGTANEEKLKSLKAETTSESLVFVESLDSGTTSNENALKAAKQAASQSLLLSSMYVASYNDVSSPLGLQIQLDPIQPHLIFIKDQNIFKYEGSIDQPDQIAKWLDSEFKPTKIKNSYRSGDVDLKGENKNANANVAENKDKNEGENANNDNVALESETETRKKTSSGIFGLSFGSILAIILIVVVVIIVVRRMSSSRQEPYIPLHKGE